MTNQSRLSYFYDRIAPLGLVSPFRISDLRQLTSDVCGGPKSKGWARFKGNKEATNELDGRPESCLDLTFQYSLLSLGYELDDERQIWMGKKVAGVELGWFVSLYPVVVVPHADIFPVSQGSRGSDRDVRPAPCFALVTIALT